jgi:hypothetical protein
MWYPNYCLNCDRGMGQDGAYCSLTCEAEAVALDNERSVSIPQPHLSQQETKEPTAFPMQASLRPTDSGHHNSCHRCDRETGQDQPYCSQTCEEEVFAIHDKHTIKTPRLPSAQREAKESITSSISSSPRAVGLGSEGESWSAYKDVFGKGYRHSPLLEKVERGPGESELRATSADEDEDSERTVLDLPVGTKPHDELEIELQSRSREKRTSIAGPMDDETSTYLSVLTNGPDSSTDDGDDLPRDLVSPTQSRSKQHLQGSLDHSKRVHRRTAPREEVTSDISAEKERNTTFQEENSLYTSYANSTPQTAQPDFAAFDHGAHPTITQEPKASSLKQSEVFSTLASLRKSLFVHQVEPVSSTQGRRYARSFVMQKARKERPWSTKKGAVTQRKLDSNNGSVPDLEDPAQASSQDTPHAPPVTEHGGTFPRSIYELSAGMASGQHIPSRHQFQKEEYGTGVRENKSQPLVPQASSPQALGEIDNLVTGWNEVSNNINDPIRPGGEIELNRINGTQTRQSVEDLGAQGTLASGSTVTSKNDLGLQNFQQSEQRTKSMLFDWLDPFHRQVLAQKERDWADQEQQAEGRRADSELERRECDSATLRARELEQARKLKQGFPGGGRPVISTEHTDVHWPDLDDDDGNASISSYAASIFSVQSLASSATNFSKGSSYTAYHIATATKELVEIFQQNELLVPLYTKAIQNPNIGPERLQRNLRRLFKQYSEDLKSEATDRLEYSAARLVSFKARFLAQSIVERIEVGHASEESVRKVKVQSVREDGSEDEEEDQTVDDHVFHDLVVFREFLVGSDAFQLFSAHVQSFVLPNSPQVSHEREQTGVVEARTGTSRKECYRRSGKGWLDQMAHAWNSLLTAIGHGKSLLEPGKTRLEWDCVSNLDHSYYPFGYGTNKR